MGEHRQASRQPAIQRRCSLGLLSLMHLEKSDHVVRIVDISSSGVGVESDEQMEPGMVWFNNNIGDHRGGVLLWSRKHDDQYRAGIRFLSFSAEDERILRNWPPCPGQLRSYIDLEENISVWMKAGRVQDCSGTDLSL
jgi:hypothetical protein